MIKVEGTLKDIKYSLKNKRIKDNESCPCGSRVEFVSCCKCKPLKAINKSKKPADVQIMEKVRSKMKRCCSNWKENRFWIKKCFSPKI